MESKDLKITAGSFIVESELSKPSKLQMLKFIQHEASDHQLMALLLDGEIVELDEQAEQIVEDRFNIFETVISIPHGAAKPILIGSLIFLAGQLAYAGFDRVFSNAGKACNNPRVGQTKSDCMRQYRIKALKVKKDILKREMKKCSKTTNPSKCKNEFSKRINSINKKIYRYTNK
jgi:hypothetical protein